MSEYSNYTLTNQNQGMYYPNISNSVPNQGMYYPNISNSVPNYTDSNTTYPNTETKYDEVVLSTKQNSQSEPEKKKNKALMVAAGAVIAAGIGYAIFHKKINAVIKKLFSNESSEVTNVIKDEENKTLPSETQQIQKDNSTDKEIINSHPSNNTEIEKTDKSESTQKNNTVGNRPQRDIAQEKLADLYEQTAQSRLKAGYPKSYKIYKDFAQKARNGEFDEQQLYKNLNQEMYNSLRIADYPMEGNRFDSTIDQLTGANTPLITVDPKDRWHYRIPNNKLGWSKDTIDRISVNAVTDKELIKKLDALFENGDIKGYYKTPNDSADWLGRHDPITIYLHEKTTPEILDKIKNATNGYIRSTEDVLVGNKFAPGMALEKSPSTEDIKKLLAEVKQVNPTYAKVLENQFTEGGKKPLRASAGNMTVANQILQMLK